MRRDSTAYSAPAADTPSPARAARRLSGIATLARLAAAMLLGALLIALAYQLPTAHTVDIGGYDAAYVQGFYDPERAAPELAGSDGSARWTRDTADLLFPQAGLPAQVSLRLRAPDGAARDVTVLLNGAQVLGRFTAGPAWQEHNFAISGGLLKPNDVVIEIRSSSAPRSPDDPRPVGVLIDRAVYRAGPAPLLPYPPQLAYAALAAGMLYLLTAPWRAARLPGDTPPGTRLSFWSPGIVVWGSGVALLALAFLLLYRAQPPYPYPLLRLLPAIDALLAAALALRYAPALRRRTALLDALALGGVAAWAGAVLLAARDHLTLSVPGVEKDFRVFALRSAHLAGSFPAGTTDPALDGVLRADGFYNLGYPLLLWLTRPLASDNPFLAARLLAAFAGALLLLAGWLLARRLLGAAPALLALLLLALSPLVVQGALTLGTDMPFAAASALALALLVPPPAGRLAPWRYALAGLIAGLAFLLRHPGLLLLPFGWLTIGLGAAPGAPHNPRRAGLLAFSLAFAVAVAPQLYVNLRDAGAPLYSQQGKNVWQAVFGEGDWGRWAEARNDIGVAQVIAQDPARFAQNWWNNLRGFAGTGGEDTREFGQALQLRLLGFPANWLALAGLLGWAAALFTPRGSREGQIGRPESKHSGVLSRFSLPGPALLLAWVALYVVAISVGLPLQGRFVLPLAPIYAAAAVWLLGALAGRISNTAGQASAGAAARTVRRAPTLLAALLLLPLLWGGFAIGAGQVLRSRPADEPARARAEGRAELPGQPADEHEIIAQALARLQAGERLIVRAAPGAPIGKYSALAHLVLPAPAGDRPATLRASGAAYLIWSTALGKAPDLGPPLASASTYQLYRLSQ